MTTLSRKKKAIIVILVVFIIGVVGIVGITLANNSPKCVDIIGDGYDMGTDPEPVVIGNTCD